MRAALIALCLLALPGRARAQELAGTHVRYLSVGPNGRLFSPATGRSLAYAELGTPTDMACDVFAPGEPAVGFTVRAVDGADVLTGVNDNSRTQITTLTGPTVEGRSLTWTGRLTGADGRALHVTQTYAYEPSDWQVTLTVVLRNESPVALTDVHYFFSGDPDHGWCRTGEYTTRNDVVRQQPTDEMAIATATVDTPGLTLAIGSFDPRARANNGGFGNTDVVAAWNTPVDQNGALVDEDIGLAFREERIEPGASTTFQLVLVFGRDVAEAVERFELGQDAPDGSRCSTGGSCASGFCVDGVCCDSACGGGASDCQACSVAAGAPANGTCALLAPTRVCRVASGPCDVAETCTGGGPACPPDALAEAGTVCRVPSDLCDAAESCTGTSPACPPDVLAVSGTVCRPAGGECDVEETCTGIDDRCPSDRGRAVGTVCRPARGACDAAELCDGSPECPTDQRVGAGTMCRASTGPCDAAEDCDGTSDTCPADGAQPDGTSCGDGLVCNGIERCMAGACVPGTPFCDDGDPCTMDACDELAGCSRTPVPGCCRTAVDCDDGDPCTIDACEGSGCVSTPLPRCREDASVTPPDGGLSDGGQLDGGAPDGDVAADGGLPVSSAGCGCRAGGRTPASGLVLVMVLTALLVVRRRR